MELKDSKPHKLLDFLVASRSLKNDRELSKELGISQTVFSRMRKGAIGVSDGLILRIHEKMGIQVAAIRALIPKDRAK